MTTSTVTRVPQQPRDEWGELDNPGLTRQQRQAIALRVLGKGRRRHPNRHGRAIVSRVPGVQL